MKAIQCFADHPGQPLETPKDQDRKKGKGGKTVSSYFKGQLDDLMGTLYKVSSTFWKVLYGHMKRKTKTTSLPNIS